MTRLARILLVGLFASSLVLSGCSGAAPKPEPTSAASVAPAPIRIGTLPTEDSLPLWLAEKQGMFDKAGLKVTITSFKSAAERDAALTAGAIDAFMGDLVAVGTLRAGGVPVRVVTVMLGATAAEGRFGIALKPGSKLTSLAELAGKPVGTSSGTIQEYVLDKLMTDAGVPADQIKREEVKAVPIRFELLMKGKLEAAALPEPFLSLAEKQGAKIVADDTKGANISQTVLVVDEKFLDRPEGAAAIRKLLGVWDEAVGVIDKDPAAQRDLLVEKARLPEPLKASYQVNTYPTAQLPKPEQVQSILDWMKSTKLLTRDLSYGDMVWPAPAK